MKTFDRVGMVLRRIFGAGREKLIGWQDATIDFLKGKFGRFDGGGRVDGETRFRILTRCYLSDEKSAESYRGMDILFITIKKYGLGWFTDCGEWFFYIYLREHGIRFSSAGFMTF